MPCFQLLDPIFQEVPLSPCRLGLGRDGIGIGVRELVDGDGGEDLLEAAYDVPFDDLCGDVGDEGFLGDLEVG